MPEDMAIAVVIVVRLPTTVEAVDGKDRDNRLVVARSAVGQGDEADSVPTAIFIVVSKITTRMNAHSVP